VTLLRPESLRLGPKAGFIVDDKSLFDHPEPLAKLVGMLAIFALSSGLRRLQLTYQKGEYTLLGSVDDQKFVLKPPPPGLSRWLPDVVRAVAGIPLSLDENSVTGDVVINVPDAIPQEWLMQVEVNYSKNGHQITFDYPSEREFDLEYLKGW